MSIEVHRKLRLLPVERKPSQHPLSARRILRQPQRPAMSRKSTGRATANPKADPTQAQGRSLPVNSGMPGKPGRQVTP